MIIYYGIYGILIVVMFMNELGKADAKTYQRNICIFAFLAITIMFALRHQSMGHDLRYLSSNGYLASFDYLSGLSWKQIFSLDQHLAYEKGFVIFNRVVGALSRDRQIFMVVCAVLSVAPIAWMIYKKSVSPAISFLVFMGLPSFLAIYSALRQVLAMGLCFLSLYFVQKKKPLVFAALVLLAWSFHSSAILFSIAYPVYYLKLKKTYRQMSVLLIPMVYVFRVPLFNILSKILKEDASTTDTGAFTLFAVFTLIYVFCIMYTDESDEQNGLMNIFLLACCCQAFGGVYYTAMRVGYYFMLSLVLLLPLVLKNMKVKENKNIYTAIVVIVFAIYGLNSIKNSTWAMAYPYYFFWEVV